MARLVTRSDLRKVRSIASIIGQEHLQALIDTDYKVVNEMHVYSTKTEEGDLVISIWSEPKENKTSRCLFSDTIGLKAFKAALDYWRPSYRPA
jgi:hypothetical protein